MDAWEPCCSPIAIVRLAGGFLAPPIEQGLGHAGQRRTAKSVSNATNGIDGNTGQRQTCIPTGSIDGPRCLEVPSRVATACWKRMAFNQAFNLLGRNWVAKIQLHTQSYS